MKDEVKIWFSQAEEHFDDMILLYKNRRYSLTVYCAHQALEMILKAAIVAFVNKIPPKSHNLDRLFEETKLKPLSQKWLEELAAVTRHYWKVRYPDFRRYTYTSREKIEPTVNFTKEVYQWVKNKLKTI